MLLVGGGIAIVVYYVARSVQPTPQPSMFGSVVNAAKGLFQSLGSGNKPAPTGKSPLTGTLFDPAGDFGAGASSVAASAPSPTNAANDPAGLRRGTRNFAPTSVRPFTFQQAATGGGVPNSPYRTVAN